jgi:hypothetical protein
MSPQDHRGPAGCQLPRRAGADSWLLDFQGSLRTQYDTVVLD